MTSPDWPLGPVLRQRRLDSQLTLRAAAQAARLSESKWRQLESGTVSMGNGQTVTVRAKAETVVPAARAVGFDPREALVMAGYDPDDYRHLLADPAAPIDDRVPGFSALTEKQREAVVQLVEAMLSPGDGGGRGDLTVRHGLAPSDIADGRVLHRRAGESDAQSR